MLAQIGKNIEAARAAAGLTPEAVAEEVGCSVTEMLGFEAGEVEPTMVQFLRTAWAIGVEPAKLVQGLDA